MPYNFTSFVNLATTTNLSYNEEAKAKFLSSARRVCEAIAHELGLSRGQYKVSINRAGIAVSGEVTLHAEHIYIQLGQSGLESRFMYRWCNGRTDYTGGQNRWMDFNNLIPTRFDNAVLQFKKCMEGPI